MIKTIAFMFLCLSIVQSREGTNMTMKVWTNNTCQGAPNYPDIAELDYTLTQEEQSDFCKILAKKNNQCLTKQELVQMTRGVTADYITGDEGSVKISIHCPPSQAQEIEHSGEKLNELQNRINEYERDWERITTELKETHAELKETQAELKETHAAKEAQQYYEAELEILYNKMKESDTEISELKEELKQSQDHLNPYVETLQETIKELRDEIYRLNNSEEINNLKIENNFLAKDLEESKQDLEEIQEKEKKCYNKIENIKANHDNQIVELKNNEKSLYDSLNKQDADFSNLKAENETLQSQNDWLRSEYRRLEEDVKKWSMVRKKQ